MLSQNLDVVQAHIILCLQVQYTAIVMTVKINFLSKIGDIFLVIDQNIDYGYSLEPGLIEYLQITSRAK